MQGALLSVKHGTQCIARRDCDVYDRRVDDARSVIYRSSTHWAHISHMHFFHQKWKGIRHNHQLPTEWKIQNVSAPNLRDRPG